MFDTVTVDVFSGLLRSENDSVPKGNILSALYLFRNRAFVKRILVSCILRESRTVNEYDYNATRRGRPLRERRSHGSSICWARW